MTYIVYVEPAHELRPRFALWGLQQTPPLNTSSATGWDVSAELYATIPAELLEGAYVDGYAYDVPMPQPEAPKAVQAPVAPREEAPAVKPKTRNARKRAAGAYTRKPSDVAAEAALSQAASDASGGGE